MSEPRDPAARPDEDAVVIRPVGYTPRADTADGGFRISRTQIAVGVAILVTLTAVWFLFTARSVRLTFDPEVESVSVSGGMSFELGGIYLLRTGTYRIGASAPGYHDLDASLTVGEERNQLHHFELAKLPGLVTFTTDPPGAEVVVDGTPSGTTPTSAIPVPAGQREVSFTAPRYQPLALVVDVTGMNEAQTVYGALAPNWAEVSVSTSPPGAEILLDDEPTGAVTPATIEALAGEHEIRLRLPGHKPHRQRILVAAEEVVTLPTYTLQQADGLISVVTRPAGAGVTLNGRFQGESPLEIAVRSGTSYRVQVFKAGYASVERSLTLKSGEEQTLNVQLDRQMGDVVVTVEPPEADIYVNGERRGRGSETLTLPTTTHRLAVRLPGYAGYESEITPKTGLVQEVRVRLLTLEEARLAALKPRIRSPGGQDLVLVKPAPFTMGASRRQPGRRANETLREVQMQRFFYLGTQEVSNAQFLAFDPTHVSGTFEEQELGKPEQPVVNLSWEDAARYCNWLSDQEKLPRFYVVESGRITGINAQATGYRLPTEAEWAYSARQVDAEAPLNFPWGGNLPPPDRHGNYADRSAAHLVGRIIFGYNDNYIAAAPVGTYAPNRLGLYDMSGNVAEWINDFYEIPAEAAVVDPLGPETGEYHVIRGSSWMHGTITDLRISFRDYGLEGRQDVGFRVARFAEPN
ncbi:MAG: PEGA domain-containing protein [Pseudomonadales bacterium]